MERVKGKYDGEKIILEEPLKKRKPGDVIVIFPDEPTDASGSKEVTGRTIAKYLDGNPAFDFLNEPEEDIYSDRDLKVKYK